MIQTDNTNTELKVTYLDGYVYQTFFDYKDEQYWIGADYYPVSDEFLVSYKIGLVKSWFASSFEYGTFFPDFIVRCKKEDIEQIVLEKIEKTKNVRQKELYTWHIMWKMFSMRGAIMAMKIFMRSFRLSPNMCPMLERETAYYFAVLIWLQT